MISCLHSTEEPGSVTSNQKRNWYTCSKNTSGSSLFVSDFCFVKMVW